MVQRKKEHFYHGAVVKAFVGYRKDSETQLPTVLLVSKNPVNVNQPGITVLFLFDMVWASLVKSVSAAP